MIKTKMNSLNISTKLKPVFMAVVVALGVMSARTLYAQEAQEAPDVGADESDIELITVTSRGRPEIIQDVPLSITAFDQEDLKRRAISELEDVARFTSGFSFEDFSGGFASPVIRGQAQTSITSLEQNVATFFDGIYIPRSWAIDIGTSSIKRIEIVKGPQSARYGRNAFSGAINYIPLKAAIGDDEVSGNVELTFGTDERQDFSGFVQIPLSENYVIAASYNTSEFDGSWQNTHPFADIDVGSPKSTEGNIGGRNNKSYSVSLAAQPIEEWTFDVAFYNYDIKNEARAGRLFDHTYNRDVFNCGNTQFGANLLICGELPSPDENATVDPRAYGIHSDTDTLRFSTQFELSDEWSLSYLYGKIEGDTDIGTSTEPEPINCGTVLGPAAGFAALCNFQTAPIGSIDYDSHEFRVNYSGDIISAAFGGFISDGEDDFQFYSYNIAPLTDENNFFPLVGQIAPSFIRDPGPFNIQLRDELTKTEVSSLFGEVQWTSSDNKSRAGAEMRYSKTEITRDVTLSQEFTVLTPRFTVERDLSEDSLLFASLARGAKAGGFNSAVRPQDQTFDEETNWTVELGSKNILMDGSLILNGTLFYTDWSDLQINAADQGADTPNATSITLNLGDAEVMGFELDAVFQANDNLSFDATLSFADAIYDSGTLDQRLARPAFAAGPSCDDIVCNSNGDVGGNELERTPRTQASFGSQWEGSLENGIYYMRGDVSWQSEFYASTANVATIPSRALVNFSAGIDLENGFNMTFFVRNLTDKSYTANSFVVLTPFNNQYGTFFGERRTAGVTVGYQF